MAKKKNEKHPGTSDRKPKRGAADRGKVVPPDQNERELILSDLNTTMLVEASAGSGKTTSLVGRMVALLREGCLTIDTLAAITFTRKAAAELRARFQVALEKAAQAAAGDAHTRLREAADHAERCFIGTIHSFCGRLLRERPVEAGVDLAFGELDEALDARLQDDAWQQYVAGLIASDAPLLAQLDELGLEVGQLIGPFKEYARYPDVRQWPAPEVTMPDLTAVAKELRGYVRHMEQLVPTLPKDPGNDKLIPNYWRLPRIVRQVDLDQPSHLMDVLAEFGNVKIVQKNWPGKKEQALAEKERWDEFHIETAEPMLTRWREKRYPVVLRALQGAVEVYDRLRRELGGLNYQDLLLEAAALLRDRPAVRRYFRQRFTHLLVDEFQDTDPIQAEVMLLLTADDPAETDWHRCRPVPGSLFVVGDPKQSIYRFRRADIVTYIEVRGIIEKTGRIVPLWANFRSVRPVVDWVNTVFDAAFPTIADAYSPARQSMEALPAPDGREPDACICRLTVPATCGNKDDFVAYESERVARTLRAAIAPDTEGRASATPEEFLLVSRLKRYLGTYAQRLSECGVPGQVTGGTVLNEVRELKLLCLCLEAISQPDNPVALVAALRSEAFGLSDPALYAFRRRGGRFSFNSPIPDGLPPQYDEPLADALERLRRYDLWLRRLPPVAALERIGEDLGLWASAAARPGGNMHAGSLGRAMELIRAAQVEATSAADLAVYLRTLVDGEEKQDGVPALPPEHEPVRVMNLHQVKGLEAPVVFLVDPTGDSDHPVTMHVDRRGTESCGYLAIYGQQRGRGAAPLLACPPQWDELAQEEAKFLAAERLRLLYVAATRAGRKLVIVQKEDQRKGNPWSFFQDALRECPELPEPAAGDSSAAPSLSRNPVAGNGEPLASPETAAAEIEARWQAGLQPGYATKAAKEISIPSTRLMPSTGEHGTEWGSVIHLLLETAMRLPNADLHALAYSTLSDHGLDPALAGWATDTVRRVTQSQIWQRAQSSQQCLVEVPFQRMLPTSPGKDAIPTVLRGVIDLAFRESNGWVIVDYKTDARPPEQIPTLVDHYQGQVRTYAAHWEDLIAQPVTEIGLYFTHVDQYIELTR